MDRSSFYAALEVMLGLTDNRLIVDVFPPASDHNTSSRILRLGLAVNAFASLESYVAGCFERLVRELPGIQVPYSQFPLPLREFLLIKAADGLVTKGSRIKGPAERLAFYQQDIAVIAAFSSVPPVYSSHGFSPKGSNVDSGDISSALRAFGIEKAWAKLSSVTQLLGLSQIDLASRYSDLASTRNRLAHNASSNIPTADLQEHIRSAISIGIVLDCMTSQVLHYYKRATNAAGLLVDVELQENHFRFIDFEAGSAYVERGYSSGAVVRRYPDLVTAIAGVSARTKPKFVVRRDASRRPMALLASCGIGIR